MPVLIDDAWLAARGPGPWFLDQPGAYQLAQDVVAPRTGFVVAAPGVTLDLAGHQLAYGSQANDLGIVVGNNAWDLQQLGLTIPPAIAGKLPTVKDSRVLNGRIRQSGAFAKGHAVWAHSVNVTLEKLVLDWSGTDAAGIQGSYCNGLTVRNCVLTSECREVPDRHNAVALIQLNQPKGVIILAGNGLYGAPGPSILCYGRDFTNRPTSVLIDQNTILPNGVAVNAYGVELGNLSSVIVARNLIKGWGRGIALDSSAGVPYPSMEKVLVLDNVVDVWERKHEYDVTFAFRMRTFDAGRFKDVLVEGNCFAARTVPGGNSGAVGGRISLANLGGRNDDAGVRLRGNRFAAVSQPGGYAHALAWSTVAPGVRPTSEGDRCESNGHCLVFGDKDGWQRPCADVTVTDPDLILTDPAGLFIGRGLGENPVTNCQVIGGRQTRPN